MSLRGSVYQGTRMQDIRVLEYQENKDARILRPDILMPWCPDTLFSDFD